LGVLRIYLVRALTVTRHNSLLVDEAKRVVPVRKIRAGATEGVNSSETPLFHRVINVDLLL
jgi:hypothetical protein